MNEFDQVRAAHQALRQAVPQKRRTFKAEWGPLARAFAEVMATWDSWRARDMLPPMTERLKGLEGVLRDVWPFTREWKYLCVNCDDIGAEWVECPGDGTCGRHREHLAHAYVKPCWCGKGIAFKDKPAASAEDFTAAGRSKSRTMTRMGRP